MKKIAIFVSGSGESTERIIRLFNEGNRLKTVLVIADDSAATLFPRIKDEEVTKLHIPDSEWHERNMEVAGLLREKGVNLIVLDDFSHSLSDEIMEATSGEILKVTTPEQAPREVVAALEADFRKPKEEPKEEIQTPTDEDEATPSLESEWAKTLKIQYTPPKIPTTPPVLPGDINPSPNQEITEEEERIQNEVPLNEERRAFEETPKRDWTQNPYYYEPKRNERTPDAPMPSTWLIWSILVTVFCCFIPGIVAIIFSSQVSTRYYMGDLQGAKRASRNAEAWIIVSIVLGVLAATLYLPFMLIGW